MFQPRRLHKKLQRLSLLLILLTFLSPVVLASSSECKEPLTLSTTSNWFPYIYKNNNDEYSGVDIELLRLVLNELDCSLRIIQFPERRSLFEISQGNYDVGLGASRNQQREKIHHYSSSYRKETNKFIYLSSDGEITQSQSLQDIIKLNKVIAINLAGWYGDEIEKAKAEHNNFIYSDTVSKRLKMLQVNRVDIVIDDDIVLCSELARSATTDMIIHPLVLYQTPIHFIFNKKSVSANFTKEFNVILERMKKDGSLAQHFQDKLSSNCKSSYL